MNFTLVLYIFLGDRDTFYQLQNQLNSQDRNFYTHDYIQQRSKTVNDLWMARDAVETCLSLLLSALVARRELNALCVCLERKKRPQSATFILLSRKQH